MTAIEPRLVAFTAPSAQVTVILDAAESVRVRLVLLSAVAADQRSRQLGLLAGELKALGQAFCDPGLDGGPSKFASALALMGEAFRNPGAELGGWCRNVLDLPPRRLAAHLQALAAALYVGAEAVRAAPGLSSMPVVRDRFFGPQLDRPCVARLKRAPLPRKRW